MENVHLVGAIPVKCSVSSQIVLKSTCSHFGQLLIDLVNSYSFGQFILTVRSIRTHFGQLVLMVFGQFVLILGTSILGYMHW